jgi:hypothetical protein
MSVDDVKDIFAAGRIGVADGRLFAGQDNQPVRKDEIVTIVKKAGFKFDCEIEGDAFGWNRMNFSKQRERVEISYMPTTEKIVTRVLYVHYQGERLLQSLDELQAVLSLYGEGNPNGFLRPKFGDANYIADA